MFAAYLRAAVAVLVAALLAAVLSFMLPYFIDLMGPEDSLMVRSFEAIADNALLLMLAGIALFLIVRAVVESSMGVQR